MSGSPISSTRSPMPATAWPRLSPTPRAGGRSWGSDRHGAQASRGDLRHRVATAARWPRPVRHGVPPGQAGGDGVGAAARARRARSLPPAGWCRGRAFSAVSTAPGGRSSRCSGGGTRRSGVSGRLPQCVLRSPRDVAHWVGDDSYSAVEHSGPLPRDPARAVGHRAPVPRGPTRPGGTGPGEPPRNGSPGSATTPPSPSRPAVPGSRRDRRNGVRGLASRASLFGVRGHRLGRAEREGVDRVHVHVTGPTTQRSPLVWGV